MSDQCKYCTLRGKLKECQATDCGHHDNWINQQLRAEVERMKPVYDAAVYLTDPEILQCLSKYTSIGASVVNTVAIGRLVNAIQDSREVDDE